MCVCVCVLVCVFLKKLENNQQPDDISPLGVAWQTSPSARMCRVYRRLVGGSRSKCKQEHMGRCMRSGDVMATGLWDTVVFVWKIKGRVGRICPLGNADILRTIHPWSQRGTRETSSLSI